jgi:hypothetical protein
MQLLGFVAAGIGVLGFVTFFGAAILWIRYDQASLPANDAVAVVPREVLLTTGASFLVPALMLALAAVLAVLLFRVALSELHHARREQQAESTEVTVQPTDSRSDGIGLEGMSRRQRFVAEAALLLTLFIMEIAFVAPDALVVSPLRTVLLLMVGFATLAASWLVLRETQRLLWFGASLFAAVSVFIAATTYVRTTDRPKLEPAAILLEGNGVRMGFYIARTPDYIYLGRGISTTGTPGGARLLAIPNGRVTQFSVGPLVSPQLIGQRAARLALGLCRTANTQGTDRRTKRRTEACSPEQVLAIRAQARAE